MGIERIIGDWVGSILGVSVWEASQPPEQREGITVRLLNTVSNWDCNLHTIEILVFKHSYSGSRDDADTLYLKVGERIGFCDGWAFKEVLSRSYLGVDLIGRYVSSLKINILEEKNGL